MRRPGVVVLAQSVRTSVHFVYCKDGCFDFIWSLSRGDSYISSSVHFSYPLKVRAANSAERLGPALLIGEDFAALARPATLVNPLFGPQLSVA